MTKMIQCISPVDGRVYAERPALTLAEAEACVARAQAAQAEWAEKPLDERIALVKQMHKLLYRDGLTLEAARTAVEALRGTVEGGDADVALLLDFLAASTRGIAR